MNDIAPAPLVFFHVLAGRGGNPSGLLLDTGAGDPGALAALSGEAAFGALNRHFPCFYREGTAPELAGALDGAGWKCLPGSAVHRADARFDTDLPPAIAWVEGEWSLAPPAKAVSAQAASRALALQLVQLVAADAHTHEIEALLRQDPTLSYHLLKLVNSLGMGTGRRVTSFSQAILILGRQQLRRWLNLMLFAARQGDVRSAMLLARVAVRARSMELMAKALGLDKPTQEQAFMTGMFSLIGVLFGMPLSDVIAPLSISDAVQAALLHKAGELGAMLQVVEAAERGQMDNSGALLAALQLEAGDFNAIVVDATGWMLEVVRESQGGGHG